MYRRGKQVTRTAQTSAAAPSRRDDAQATATSAKASAAVSDGIELQSARSCRWPSGGNGKPGMATRGRGRAGSRFCAALASASVRTTPAAPRRARHITRLKLIRRQMYGRGKLDLLRARLLAPA
mgnify:CR=1 FL=1